MNVVRSILFNLLFFGSTLLACIVLLPGLLFTREVGLGIARLWLKIVYFLEKHIMGLDYEIRGLEHLPKDGESYIVAAKHQSAYETMKLHALFGDPSIVLKKELLLIPLWGWFLKKVDVIAINRKNRDQAMQSIIDGARRMKAQKRPIVIFPQGTRVAPETTTKEKPYKGGIVKMAQETGLPIIPLAMNSGVYWRRNSFMKYPGTVVFEFLPPVDMSKDRADVLKDIENGVEGTSLRLMAEAKDKHPELPYTPPKALDHATI
jgi:1-acyl-sn-glycerol-3-phosphate acyltransferase